MRRCAAGLSAEQKQVRRFSDQVVPPPSKGDVADVDHSKNDDAGVDDEQADLGRALAPPDAETEHRHGGGLARADANAVGVASVGLVSNPDNGVSSHDQCFCGSDVKSFSNRCLSSRCSRSFATPRTTM